MFIEVGKFTINVNLVRYICNHGDGVVRICFDLADERLSNADYIDLDGEDAEAFLNALYDWEQLKVYHC